MLEQGQFTDPRSKAALIVSDVDENYSGKEKNIAEKDSCDVFEYILSKQVMDRKENLPFSVMCPNSSRGPNSSKYSSHFGSFLVHFCFDKW